MLNAATAMAQAQKLRLGGDARGAAEVYRQILREDPRASGARKALAALPEDIRKSPLPSGADAAALIQMEAALAVQDWPRVLKLGQPVLSRTPTLAAAAEAMGLALVQLGRKADATRAFNHAIRADPARHTAYVNLATLLRTTGQFEAAGDAINAALELEPSDPNALATRGLVWDDLDQPGPAQEAFEAALAQDARHVAAHDGLCRLFEKSNQLDALAKTVATARAACPDSAEIALREGQLFFRQGEQEQAIIALNAVPEDQLRPEMQAMRQELLGKSHDALNQAAPAFAAFSRMNAITSARQSADVIKNNPFQAALDAKLKNVAQIDTGTWPAPSKLDAPKTPAFLVGFPRSGTTLLDTILRGHPDTLVAEEKPTIQTVTADIPAEGLPEALQDLSEKQISDLRALYFETYEREAGEPIGDRLAIDKMPLNMADAAVIHRLFPDARFILALRHPCDCVLSCFMQNFTPNAAMNSFLDLETTARTYDRVFTLWGRYVTGLNLPVSEIRYEDVIHDMEATVRPLIDFLDLPWSDKVLDTQKTARARKKIKTSSYRQVTQKIYTSADGRWRRYEDQLKPVLPILEPWIDHWGYSA